MAPTHDFFLRLFYTSPMYVLMKFIGLDMPGTPEDPNGYIFFINS